MADGYHALRELAPTEAEFQAQVVQLAGILGWQVLHVRRSIGKGRRWTTTTSIVGWPDLFLWHPRHGVLARELKTDTGRLTPEQEEVLASLCAAGVDAGVWRPADFTEEIPSTLSGEPTAFAAARACDETDRLRGLLARALPHVDPNDDHGTYLLVAEIEEALCPRS